VLIEKIKAEHFSPPPIDEKFHASVIQEFLEIVDPHSLYFVSSDVRALQDYPLKLSEPTQNSSCGFIEMATQRYQKKLTEATRIVSLKISKPFDFTQKDSLHFTSKKTNEFAENSKELERHWEIRLKSLTLSRMAQTINSSSAKDWMAGEQLARLKIGAKENGKISRLLNGNISPKIFIANALMKAIALAYDPHTNFFTRTEIKDFESSVSSSLYSFGFDLGENSLGEMSVERLAPGGPAWNSHLVNKGDVITSVTWSNGEVSNSIDFDEHEFEELVKARERSTGVFTVKKNDGSTKEVRLQKEKRESIENNVRSLLLKGEKPVGYISLPGFYSDWGGEEQSCAADVAKEIIKLKKENIQGLILDLRFNGGGSLQEAIELAGIFIDVGPLLLLKSKDEKVLSLKDFNRGLAYDGLLVILVNGFSASASEIVAAGLQDHNRAIVVGSTTFGKSTSQSVFPLTHEKDTLGYVKITLDKAYRITGKSHQLKGVEPDIYLPDFYSIFEISERNYRHALPNDSVVKKVYYTPFVLSAMAPLKKQSEARMAGSSWFKHLQVYRKFYLAPISLEINAFIKHHQIVKDFLKGLEANGGNAEKSLYKVMQNKFDSGLLGVDDNRQQISQQLVLEIERSVYIEEAFQIITDYLSPIKK
jgi:carboxyl-terminal processing protease